MNSGPDSTRFTDEVPQQEPDADSGSDLPETPEVAESPDVGLLDAAPGTEEELAQIDARQAEQDSTHQARAEAARLQRAAKRKEQYDPEITVDRQDMITVSADAVGHAICPACQAKNTLNAAICGRCAAQIPSAIPTRGERRGGRRNADYAGYHERMDEQDERAARGDAWEMLPEEKRHEFEEAAEQKEERRIAAVKRVRAYRNRIVALGALCSAVLGVGTTAFSVGFGVLGLFSFLFDASAGAAAGYYLYTTQGGQRQGLMGFLAVAVLSISFKLAGGGIAVMLGSGIGGAVLLLFYIAHLMALMVGGHFAGRSVEQEFLDSHS